MSIKCELCDKVVDTVYAYENMEMCEDCFKRLVSIMKYKNHNDIVEDDKTLLMKFCNKLVSQLFACGVKNEEETIEEEKSNSI